MRIFTRGSRCPFGLFFTFGGGEIDSQGLVCVRVGGDGCYVFCVLLHPPLSHCERKTEREREREREKDRVRVRVSVSVRERER